MVCLARRIPPTPSVKSHIGIGGENYNKVVVASCLNGPSDPLASRCVAEGYHVCGLDVTSTRDRDAERATRLWQPTWTEILLEASAQGHMNVDQLDISC